MQFYYRAITAQGERVSGTHESRNATMARRELSARYESLLECREADQKEVAAARARAYRVKPEAVAIFFRRMATMLQSGVALADALNFMITSEADKELSDAVDYLLKQVLGGHTLSNAMRDKRLARVFDPVSIGMVQLGEQTGQLTKIMQKLADLKERQLSLTRSMVSALTYPAVLLCVIVAIGLLFTLILGPGDGGLFGAFGNDLPWPTRVVQAVSSYLRQPIVLLIGAVALVAAVTSFRLAYRHNEQFRLKVDVGVIELPLIGPLVQKIECARILYVMADGLEVGLPAVQVLSMARDVCGNEKVKVEINGVLRRFADGSELTECLQQYQLFPPMVISMVEVGMESGQLDRVLAQACIGYEEDVQMTLDSVTRLAEPLLLMFAGFMAGFLALATLLPIIKMVQNI